MPKFNRGDTVKVLYISGKNLPDGSYCIIKGLTPNSDNSGDDLMTEYDITLYIPGVEAGIETTAVQSALVCYEPVEFPNFPIPEPLPPQNLPPVVAYRRIVDRISARTYAIKMYHWKSYASVVAPAQLQIMRSAYESYVNELLKLFKTDLFNAFNQFFCGDTDLFEEIYTYVAERKSDVEELAEEMHTLVSVFYCYKVTARQNQKRTEIVKAAKRNVQIANKLVDAAWQRWEDSAKDNPDQYRPVSEDLFGAYAYLVSMQSALIDIAISNTETSLPEENKL